jgi:acyl carrier protein
MKMKIFPTMTISFNWGMSTLFAIKLLNFVEKEFNIIVENDEMDISNFSSISSIVQLVEKKISRIPVYAN